MTLRSEEDDEYQQEGSPNNRKDSFGLVTALFKDEEDEACIQTRLFLRAQDTVLGDAGGDWELYATEELQVHSFDEVVVSGLVQTTSLHNRAWDWTLRRQHFQEDEARRSVCKECEKSV